MSIHSFIVAHQDEIHYSSFTADQLEVTLKDTVGLGEAIVFFVDLITHCQPTAAHVDISNRFHIRLVFA